MLAGAVGRVKWGWGMPTRISVLASMFIRSQPTSPSLLPPIDTCQHCISLPLQPMKTSVLAESTSFFLYSLTLQSAAVDRHNQSVRYFYFLSYLALFFFKFPCFSFTFNHMVVKMNMTGLNNMVRKLPKYGYYENRNQENCNL